MQFFTDIVDIARTRKFWMGLATVVAQYIAIVYADTEVGGLVIGLLGAFGIYTVPNKK